MVKRVPSPGGAVARDVSAALRHDAVRDREPQLRPVPDLARREHGLEDPLPRRRVQLGPGVGNLEHDEVARRTGGRRQVALVGESHADRDGAAAGHPVARVDREVEEQLLDLRSVRAGEGRVRDVEGGRYLVPDSPAEHPEHVARGVRQVERLDPLHLPAREREELARDRRGLLGGAYDVVELLRLARPARQLFEDERRRAHDDAEQVVELVGDAPRQTRDRLHPPGPDELRLRALEACQARAEALVRRGELRRPLLQGAREDLVLLGAVSFGQEECLERSACLGEALRRLPAADRAMSEREDAGRHGERRPLEHPREALAVVRQDPDSPGEPQARDHHGPRRLLRQQQAVDQREGPDRVEAHAVAPVGGRRRGDRAPAEHDREEDPEAAPALTRDPRQAHRAADHGRRHDQPHEQGFTAVDVQRVEARVVGREGARRGQQHAPLAVPEPNLLRPRKPVTDVGRRAARGDAGRLVGSAACSFQTGLWVQVGLRVIVRMCPPAPSKIVR